MKKEKRDKEEEKERIYSEKKEQVYIAVLDRLLQVRRGFDYSKEFVERNDEYKSGWMNKIKNIWKFHQSLGYMRQILFLDYVSILFYMPGLHIPQ